MKEMEILMDSHAFLKNPVGMSNPQELCDISSVFLYGNGMWRVTMYIVECLHVFLRKCLKYRHRIFITDHHQPCPLWKGYRESHIRDCEGLVM